MSAGGLEVSGLKKNDNHSEFGSFGMRVTIVGSGATQAVAVVVLLTRIARQLTKT